ncbi:MAG: glycosyltransferase family 4 protein [Acidobacteria bacterium]|nr:glycosyltransferase family 4 protein [Acidobacteriota bacterium]
MRIVVPVIGVAGSGGFRVLTRFATEWAAVGHDVRIVAVATGRPPYFPTAASFVWVDQSGNPVPSHARHDPRRVEGVGFVVRTMRALSRALSRLAEETDLLLANHSLTAWCVAWQRTSATKVYYVQAYEVESLEGPRLRRWPLAALAYASYHLPMRRIVNAPVFRRYRNLRADAVVPPGIDSAHMFPRATPACEGTTAPVIGCIGRKQRWKGTADVVDAVERLVRAGRQVRLRVAYHLPEGVRPSEFVELVVPRDDCELGEFYRGLDVLVAPATTQLGSVHYPVLEGMATAVPVVTTGYHPAHVDADNAWIVPPHSPAAIAEAVVGVMDDVETRRRRVSRALSDVSGLAWPGLARQFLEESCR